MNTTGFREAYRKLISNADSGAELFESEESWKLLEEAGIENAPDLLLIMQLAQEKYLRCEERCLKSKDLSTVTVAVENAALDDLRERLSNYPSEMRRGILMDMYERAAALNGRALTERDRVVWAHTTEDTLARSTAFEITRCAGRLAGGMGEDIRRAAEEDKEKETEQTAPVSRSAAAAAVAELRGMFEARVFPIVSEGVGAASAATASMAEEYRKEELADIAEIVGGMLLLAAVVLLVSILLADAFGVGVIFVAEAVETGSPMALAAVVEVFTSLIKEMSLMLKIIGGAGAVGALAMGAARLARAFLSDPSERTAVDADEAANGTRDGLETVREAAHVDEDDDEDEDEEDDEDEWEDRTYYRELYE